MLTPDEVARLIPLCRAGDRDAIEQMVAHNMPLVKSIVRRYRNCGVDYDDLVQLGTWGLYKAVLNFDLSFGVRFSTYAVPMIAGEIKRHIRDEGPIKVSRQTKTLAQHIGKYVETYRMTNGTDPTLDQIAAQFALDAADVVYALDSVQTPVSLYEQYDEDGSYLIDTIQTKDETEERIDRLLLHECIADLPERDRKIILLRYFRDKTQTEVAAMLGISQVQVSRLEARILRDLRAKMQ